MKPSTRRLLSLVLPVFVAGPANAIDFTPEAVGLHVGSYHTKERLRLGEQWNNVNPGAYVRFKNGITTGIYRNSVNRDSFYLAHTLQSNDKRWAITYGAASNYERVHQLGAGPAPAGLTAQLVCVQIAANHTKCERIAVETVWVPLLAISHKVPTPWFDLRLAVLPPTSKATPTTWHLTLEKEF